MIRIFFLREGGERLGLVVEDEEHLGLAPVLSIFNCTTVSTVEEFRARQARTRLYYTESESSVASFHGKGSGHRGVFNCTTVSRGVPS